MLIGWVRQFSTPTVLKGLGAYYVDFLLSLPMSGD